MYQRILQTQERLCKRPSECGTWSIREQWEEEEKEKKKSQKVSPCESKLLEKISLENRPLPSQLNLNPPVPTNLITPQ